MIRRRPEFPGMDPWLEHPELWPDVHNTLIAAIADELRNALRGRYFVGVESRTTVLHADQGERWALPDVAIRELEARRLSPGAGTALAAEADDPAGVTVLELELPPVAMEVDEWYLEVRTLPSRKVVTAIEVLTPTNKRPGPGRRRYLRKRDRVLDSRTSLVEIDLIRAGKPMPVALEPPPDDYRILVCRGRARPRATYYGFGCRVAIPDVPIPLLPGEPEALLPLNRVLHDLVERAQYFVVAEYGLPPVPPLRPADAEWAAAIIEGARRRGGDAP